VTAADLPRLYREKAALLERYAPAAAEAFREAAELAQAALHASEMEALDLARAEIESGYTRGHLLRLLAEGRIPNASTAGTEPTILRRDLPRKPGYGVANARPRLALSRSQVARAVATGER
jgi:hypothetical protein